MTPPPLINKKMMAFQEKYWNDPAGFVEDCVNFPEGKRPYPHQLDILSMIKPFEPVSPTGPRSLGKTAVSSWALLWFALTRDGVTDWKVITTASVWDQMTMYFWPEVRKWSALLKWDRTGRDPYVFDKELMKLSLVPSKRWGGTGFAKAETSTEENAQTMEGAHASQLFYIFDEAKLIPKTIFDSVEGAFGQAQGEWYWLVASTPSVIEGGVFYDIHAKKSEYFDWKTRKVTLQESLDCGAVSPEWIEKMKIRHGEKSAWFITNVLGDFASKESNGLIDGSVVDEAVERWYAWEADGFPGNLTCVSVDVALGHEGNDKVSIALVYDHVKVREIQRFNPQGDSETMEIVDYIQQLLADRKKTMVIVDSIGIGKGVHDRLLQLGYNVYGFVASAGTDLRDQSGEQEFENWRAAAWWITREILSPISGIGVCLPPDKDDIHLKGDLIAPLYLSDKKRIAIESKLQLRRRIGRSTDDADSVIQGLVGPLLVRNEFEDNETYRVVDYSTMI